MGTIAGVTARKNVYGVFADGHLRILALTREGAEDGLRRERAAFVTIYAGKEVEPIPATREVVDVLASGGLSEGERVTLLEDGQGHRIVCLSEVEIARGLRRYR